MALWYVTQSGAGSQNGLSLGNAWSVANYNASTTSTAGGDTVFFSGTISQEIDVPHSGTAGNSITLDISQATLSAGAFTGANYTNSCAIRGFGSHDITIDGKGTGVISCTDNGTGLTNKINCFGISWPAGGTNLTVKNCLIGPIYARTAGSDGNAYGRGVSFKDGNGTGLSNVLVTNNTIHDAYNGIETDFGVGDSNYTISFNNVYNCNWGGSCSDRGATSTMTGLSVHDNHFHDFTCWDAASDIGLHHNGFYTYCASGGTATIGNFYNNIVGPNFTNYLSSYNAQSTGLWADKWTGPVTFYNNLFISPTGIGPANGLLKVNLGTTAFYNNTFICGSTAGTGVAQAALVLGTNAGSTTTTVLENNLFTGTVTAISETGNASVVSLTSSNNIFYGTATFDWTNTGSGNGISLATWQATTFTPDASFTNQTANPSLNTGYQPSITSTARGIGLASVLATVPLDLAGRLRPSPPCIGAYEAWATTTSALSPNFAVVLTGP